MEEQQQIATKTVGQFDNHVYISHRLHRLTASNFGAVVKRRASTPCDALVKRILKTNTVGTSAMEYGKRNESVAIGKFSDITGYTVLESGIFISTEYGFLAASPDGKT